MTIQHACQPEKRRQRRVVRQDLMAYTIFSLRHWDEVETLSRNLSRSGVGFMSARPLPPRTVLCIRSKPDGGQKKIRDQTPRIPLRVLAEVKWCRSRQTPEGPMFDIGAAYL